MPDPITISGSLFLGAAAAELIEDAVGEHVKGHLCNFLKMTEGKALQKKEQDALHDAYKGALRNAYDQALTALGNVLNLVVKSGTEFITYRVPVENFLCSEKIAVQLMDSIRNLSNSALPDPVVLEQEWHTGGGEEFSIPGVWQMVAANFRKGALEKSFVTPQLREILNAQNIARLVELQETLHGVQISVGHDQYVRMMKKRYEQIELANIAPASSVNHGVLVVSDIFEPQHVRENPPPIEITKDEFEKLALKEGLTDNDSEAVLELLEDGNLQNAAEQLKFQRVSYAEQQIRPVVDVITSFHKQKKNQWIVLTGEPGSGKSTLMRYLLLGILDPPADPNEPEKPLAWTQAFTSPVGNHFPFLIELREYHYVCEQEEEVNSIMDYARYLGETMSYGIDDESLDKKLKETPSLVMFDGLDEIFDPHRRETVMQEIVGFADVYPLAQIIVTSRPHGYREGILRPAGFTHFRLQDLDREQKERFSQAWFNRVFPNDSASAQQRIDRVMRSVDRSQSVRWLAGNPLLLTIMCLIARERELPEERAEFYEQCLDVLVHQWESNNQLITEDLEFLTVYRKKELLREIAFEMQASSAGLRGNFISEEQLLNVTCNWFKEHYEDLKGAAAERTAQQMVERLWHRNYILCPRGPKLYGFLHRTFMEFLTAQEYVRRFEKTDEFTLEDLQEVFRKWGDDPDWNEVLRLVCSEIGDNFAEQLIRALVTLKPFPEGEINKENQPNHFVLAIRCMGELRGLSKLEELGVFLFEELTLLLSKRENWWVADSYLLELRDAIEEIGMKWPGREQLKTRGRDFHPVNYGNRIWGEVAAAIFRDRQLTEELASYSFKDDPVRWTWNPRISPLCALTKYWPDSQSKSIVAEACASDPVPQVRMTALALLAGNADWANDDTRMLITTLATEDEDPNVRAMALRYLASNPQWADDDTGTLLRNQATEDEDVHVRVAALKLLASNPQWVDDNTRRFIENRAAEDVSFHVRAEVLKFLASNPQWRNVSSLRTLEIQYVNELVRDGRSADGRGRAFNALFSGTKKSDNRKQAESLLFVKTHGGLGAYSDPHNPVTDEHLARVAEAAGLNDAELEQMVQEVNELLGWDIREGYSPP